MTSVHWRHFNRRVGKRALLGCMLVAAAVEMFWANSRRELERVRSPEPTAAPPAPAPAVAVAPSVPVGPSGLDGSLVLPQVTFESGFCAPEGDETIELHYSLRRLLIEELHRRLQPDGGYAGGAPRHRDLPTGASWMRRSRRRAPARPSATVGEAGLLGVSVHAHP